LAYRNIKPIVESFHKNEYEKSLVYVCSKNTDQEIAKNQKFNSDVMDIHLNPLSNSTFIGTINLQKLQENKHNNTKVIKINCKTNKKKKGFFSYCLCCVFVDFITT